MIAFVAILVIAGAAAVVVWQMYPQLLSFGSQQAAAAPDTGAPTTPEASIASPSAVASQAAPTREAAEAALLADPIDGPFFREFKEILPGDYSAVMGYLLVQVPDPARNMTRFDELLGERLGVMRFANSQDIAGAADDVLAEMADNMLLTMRAPEYCQAALDPDMGGLDIGNTATRRLATKINTSIIRAIASGRLTRIVRDAPTPAQVEAFNTELEQKLYARHWQAYLSGSMDTLPPDEQCAIYVGYWNVIADYPAPLGAVWTANQMAQPAQ